MKTDDLIKTLAEDSTPPAPLWRSTGVLALAGCAAALVLFFAAVGLRPNLAEAMGTGPFQLKMTVFMAATLVTAADYWRLMRPGAAQIPYGVFAAAAILAMTAAYQLTVTPPDAWQAQMYSGNWRACLMTVPVLALFPLAAAIAAMRAAAPGSPSVAGLAAAGVAAAVGSAIYAMHCPADSPLFYVVWYSLGGMAILAAGALAGRLTLRW